MKSFLFSLLFLFEIVQAKAQQNHFIYIQTENSQTFYVRIADRLLSSSSAGYVVIPKLQNGTYDLNIGFPKNEWPTQKITITVKDKDAGYVLKNFDAKGWGLFNMQSMDVVMATGSPATSTVSKDEGDGFADVLADVVSTPSIKQKTPANEQKPEPKKEVDNKEPGKKEPVQEPVKQTSTTQQPVETKQAETIVTYTAPRKVESTLDNTGRSIVYIDRNSSAVDTVRIFIPYSAASNDQVQKPVPVVEKKETSSDPAKEKAVEKQDGKFLDIDMGKATQKSEPTMSKDPLKQEQQVVKAAPMVNSDCKAQADEDDFLKLRKKMAAQKTDENMIVVAKKVFVNKCFTTEQISNLSVLFLKDEGRYNFFDAAYSRVVDSQNYSALGSKLTDEYYVNRFKAMLRHQ